MSVDIILYRSMLWVRVSVCVYMHVCVLMRIPRCIDLLPCHLLISHVLIFSYMYTYWINDFWFLISGDAEFGVPFVRVIHRPPADSLQKEWWCGVWGSLWCMLEQTAKQTDESRVTWYSFDFAVMSPHHNDTTQRRGFWLHWFR